MLAPLLRNTLLREVGLSVQTITGTHLFYFLAGPCSFSYNSGIKLKKEGSKENHYAFALNSRFYLHETQGLVGDDSEQQIYVFLCSEGVIGMPVDLAGWFGKEIFQTILIFLQSLC